MLRNLFIYNFFILQRVQAMNMFQADVKSPWTYDHCWEVLKYCDKWMIIPQSNLRAPSPVFEEQKLQLLKEQADREDVQLEITRRAEDRLQMIADDAIMEKNTSHMSVEQQHYYQLRKNAIMAKAMKNASNSNFNVLPDY